VVAVVVKGGGGASIQLPLCRMLDFRRE